MSENSSSSIISSVNSWVGDSEEDSNSGSYMAHQFETSSSDNLPAVEVQSTNHDVGNSSSIPQTDGTTTNDTPTSSIAALLVPRSNSPIAEPPAKLRKISQSPPVPCISNDQDGETCPICLDVWDNSGEHRLVALKCGHLFGQNCVLRWLKGQAAKDKSCPTCKTKANNRDIRFIFARKLVAADNSEVTALKKRVEILESEKNKLELEMRKFSITHSACLQQMEALKNRLNTRSQAGPQIVTNWRFALERTVESCNDCRVLTYNCRTYEFYISQKSSNNLFPGYGVRRISCFEDQSRNFLHLHPKPIRDLAYSQPKDLLLSVSLDNSIRVVERDIPCMTINTQYPLWSCAWNMLHNEEFYVGGSGGTVLQYDLRNTGSPLHKLSIPTILSPVVSLASTEFGLLSCQLNLASLWVPNEGQWEPNPVPVEGTFMSASYDSEMRKVLFLTRPSSSGSGYLTICKLNPESNKMVCEVEQKFRGTGTNTVMTRGTWVKAPGATWAAAYSESDSALWLHGMNSVRTMSLPLVIRVSDLCSVQINGETILAALSDSKLRMYKAVKI